MKRFVIIMIILIIILSLVLFFKIQNSNISSNEIYSREEIISLAKNSETFKNYSCEYTISDTHISRKIKDNKMVIFTNDMSIYIDYDTNEIISLKPSRNLALTSSLNSSTSLSFSKLYFQDFLDALNDCETYEYKFSKKETINNFECLRFTLTSNLNNWDLWIDSQTGFLVNAITTTSTESTLIKYNLNLNSVTDEDVAIPDLSTYTIVQSQ